MANNRRGIYYLSIVSHGWAIIKDIRQLTAVSVQTTTTLLRGCCICLKMGADGRFVEGKVWIVACVRECDHNHHHSTLTMDMRRKG